MWPLDKVHTGAETNQGRKLFKGGNYSRKYGIWNKNIHSEYFLGHCVVSVRLQFTLYMFMQRKLIAMTHEVAYT